MHTSLSDTNDQHDPPSIHYTDDTITLWHGDALATLRQMPDQSVNCIATSPPYYFMRDYGETGQYGLEATPGEYIATLAAILTECRRILAADGTLWLNLGDAYSQRKAIWPSSHQETRGRDASRPRWRDLRLAGLARMSNENLIDGSAVAEKSLMMLPERIILEALGNGWILRNKITWHKRFTKPDAAPDRLANRSEHIYLLVKSHRYWFNRNALGTDDGDVWHLPASAYPGAHTATYPPELPERCIIAGCRPAGIVLDPFAGSCTTGMAALRTGRRFVGIDLSATYLDLALETRLAQATMPFEVAS